MTTREEIAKGIVKPETTPEDDELIFDGAEVKDLGDGKVGGYLIRFSTRNDPDLTGDYFTKDSAVDIPLSNLPIFYHHGKDTKMGKRIIGRGTVTKDDVGYWLESQLNQRDEYEKAVLAMVKAGKLGYSSGALPHLVEREPMGKSVSFIKTWVVGEASLTIRAAEPRNQVVSLKSLSTPDLAALPNGGDNQPDHKEIEMADNAEIKAAVDAALAERDAAAKTKADHEAELKAAKEEGAKAAVKELTEKGALKVSYHTTEKRPDSDGGAEAFKSWLKTGQVNHELIDPSGVTYTDEMGNTKAAYNVSTNDAGAAYLVPDPLYQQIIAKRTLASWVRQAPVQSFSTPADHLLVPRENTSATAFVLTNEAGSYNEDEPSLTQKDLILYKYTKLVKMSEEFIQYNSTNFDAWLTNALARAEAITENTIYTLGTGTGNPEGIVTNAGLGATVTTTLTITPANVTALVGSLGAGYNTGAAECGFLSANVTKWYLHGVQTTGFFAFIPTPSAGPVGSNYGGALGQTGFLGYPAFVSDDMDSYYLASGYKPMIFANFNFYGIVEKPGLLIQRNPYLYMATGQIGIFATMFRGGGVLQTEAVKYLATA